MISIGLVGCGAVVHSNYASSLLGRTEYRVEYVCDLDPAQAASAADLFGAEVVTIDGIAQHADAVVISTPPSSHASLVRACLREDRVILCEKPFMTTLADAGAIVEESEAARSPVFVSHFRRTFPHLELARRIVQMGVIGEVTGFQATEGGRFTWPAVSDYPVKDPSGGVLWDTGSHTLDMALYAANLDDQGPLNPRDINVEKNKPEPSHDFRAEFVVGTHGRTINGRIHVSRRQSLPNLIHVEGSRGSVTFVPDLDDRIRLTTERGSTVLLAGTTYSNLFEGFDLQMRRVLLERSDEFAASRFLGQVSILEALAHA